MRNMNLEFALLFFSQQKEKLPAKIHERTEKIFAQIPHVQKPWNFEKIVSKKAVIVFLCNVKMFLVQNRRKNKPQWDMKKRKSKNFWKIKELKIKILKKKKSKKSTETLILIKEKGSKMGRIKRHRVVPLRYSSSRDWNDVKLVVVILR